MARKRKIDIEDYRDLSNLEGIIYTFITERGMQEMEYSDYLRDMELRSWISDTSRYRLVLGRTVFSFTPAYLNKNPDRD